MPIWVPAAKWLIRMGLAGRLPSVRRLMGDATRYLPYFSRRVLGSPVVELKQARERLTELSPRTIDLSLAAPPPDPALWSEPFSFFPTKDYPPLTGFAALRNAISEKLARDNHLCHGPDDILVTNGVSQGIGLVLDTFVDVGDRVALFDPSFLLYRLAAANRGARIVWIRAALEMGRIRFSDRALSRALRGTKLLILNSPANPTGGVFLKEDLERIAYWCRRRDVLILSDEVYERYCYLGEPASIARLADAQGRTITANGFSKSHGLTAFRIGYLAGPKPLIDAVTISALTTAPFVSAASQEVALRALQADAPEPREIYRGRRNRLVAQLNEAGLPIERPGGAFFFWIPTARWGVSGDEFAERLLDHENVRVLAGTASGPSGAGYVRVSFAGAFEPIEEGFRRLARFAASLNDSRDIPGQQRRAA